MRVEIYIIVDPRTPDRAYVSAWPPSRARLTALRAAGCFLHLVTTTVPDPEPLDLIPVSAPAEPLAYLGRRVSYLFDQTVRLGEVTRETAEWIDVTWSDGCGTFSRQGFVDNVVSGRLKLLEDNTNDQQASDPSSTHP